MRAAASPAHLTRLILLGQLVDPSEALQLQLVDALLEPDALLDAALARAAALAELPAASSAPTKAKLLFFFNDTAPTEIYTLSLHDALPILIENGEKDECAARRRRLGEIQLTIATRVVESAKGLAVELLSQFPRGRMNGGRERARGHDVHRARESELRDDLSARMQQQPQHRSCFLHKLAQRGLHPCLDRSDGHGRDPAALIISTRIIPMFAAGSATTTRTRSLWPAAQIRPRSASSCMNVAVPSRAAPAESLALR